MPATCATPRSRSAASRTKPWRVPAAEQALIGRPLSEASMSDAADALLQGAQPLPHNAFKLPLARRSIARALQVAVGVA